MNEHPCPSDLELDHAFSVGADPALIAHLGTCEACRSVWDETRSAIELLRERPVALPSAPDREERRSAVLAAWDPGPPARIEEPGTLDVAQPRPRPRRIVATILGAASLVAVILAMHRTRHPTEVVQEIAFVRGWEAMRHGDFVQAAAVFDHALALAPDGALADDAMFWHATAVARVHRTSDAIAALRTFLDAYPASTRAGEAAAMLGWLLVETRELDEARRWFHAAEHDPHAGAQASARAGLELLGSFVEPDHHEPARGIP